MKRKKLSVMLLTALATLAFAFGLCSCDSQSYNVTIDMSKSFVLEIGDTVDFKQYFTVTDKAGNQIVITDKMLDTSKADTTKEGQFTVTLTIGSAVQDLTFTVKKGSGGDLSAVFAKYADESTWNFAVKVEVSSSAGGYEDWYEYFGNNVLYGYEYEGDEYTHYLGYDAVSDKYTFYYDNGDGVYDEFDEDSDDYIECYYSMNLVYLSKLADFAFTATNGGYAAVLPNEAGNAVLGEYEDSVWTSFNLYTASGNISKIVAVTSDGYTFAYEFSKYGAVSFTLPSSGGTVSPVTPTGTMEKQTYDAATFDDGTLQEKLTTVGEEPDPAIGLPSTGTYSALVVPIKFTNTEISSQQLTNLNIAFNGTSDETGWESVKTYYQKASYGKLNLSFDIAGHNMGTTTGYYTAKYNSSYYESHTATDEESGEKYNDGDNLLLHEVLAYYENILDLTKYDTNNDGTIDAVYLIYSADVDYESDDSFYWAYVTWNYDETKYDGKDAFYYLFAGLGFMEESVQGGFTNQYYPVISGLKVNASTYIHESGHLLGLDDYYDYYPNEGCNEGLGGADMMDYTVGDQNVYSKTMLGWLTPQIVTETKTVTIQSSQSKGDAILIPLNFNNSYFCEYLMIDLYSAQGLNAMHSSSLYGGASYGVRIYHVSSSINHPWENDLGSFTDYNNSETDFALIKLVEADGETKFMSTNGEAAQKDLWKAGDKLSAKFPKYTRNDGKLLNFDVTIVSVSATQATVTITYNS